MPNPKLQVYLMAFMVVVTLIILFWNKLRLDRFSIKEVARPEMVKEYKLLKRISGYYWLIFSCFGLMTIVYAGLPQFYYLFLPLDAFDLPVINTMGLLILGVSLVWIIIAQIQIDKELYRLSRNIEKLEAMEMVRFSERLLISGMFILFLGFSTTITNIMGIVLVLISGFIYLKQFSISRDLYI
ncbi:hypothetical protein [Echinicola vietnamensis]|uniref:Uncharacterized protein n=1 Tax=Echinicola vietnamensis (strain DSM 17526 / LMG 23754 / KMM 6221) TaxID=926556 RepID=L0G6E8_ECHVK|nr:hypothetical protein [Echinicola vietnamensis]AGA80561.1 hypothetical protein Echvi_4377 [Echinicola vietnamensis DSM 17526]